MSRRELGRRIGLDLSDEQLEIVRDRVFGALIGRAGDLRQLNRHRDPRRAVREVAALGRLAFWLHHGEIRVPDRTAHAIAVGLAEEVEASNQEWIEAWEDAVAENAALRAFASSFEGVGPDA
jgi:hypothetical protein